MRMRDNRLDVAKGVLIVLVVLGHLLEEVSGEWEDGLVRLVLTVIYAFHMPAFVFLAGLTAKSTRLLERLLTFVMLLGVFQYLYFVAKECGREIPSNGRGRPPIGSSGSSSA